VLSKKVCMDCHGRWAKGVFLNLWKWSKIDEEMWKEGRVSCPICDVDPTRGVISIQSLPPQECQYYLEHCLDADDAEQKNL